MTVNEFLQEIGDWPVLLVIALWLVGSFLGGFFSAFIRQRTRYPEEEP